MIIWGGGYASGGVYDPSSDTWAATSLGGAPSARINNTAVWTGSEMIVWGGFSSLGVVRTGGRYDPLTDMWVATTLDGAPIARDYHTAVWTGSEMIIWGGYNGAPIGSGALYTP
jgi:hypothetical protein